MLLLGALETELFDRSGRPRQ